MIASHDVFAETNPAYCATVLIQFCEAYMDAQAEDRGVALPLLYLTLPLVLSEDLASIFDGCNRNTGLAVWLGRSANALTDLPARVNGTLQLTTSAIQFACLTGRLSYSKEGELISMFKKIPSIAMTGVAAVPIKRAKLLAAWLANAGSARAVLEVLGVSV